VKLGNERGLGMVLNSLGGVLQRQGRLEEAEKAFTRSLEIGEKLGDERGLGMVGRLEEAEKAFTRSLEIGEKIGDEKHLAMVLNSLGGVLQRQGHLEEAEKAFTRSADIEVKLGDERGLGMVLNSLGGVLQRQGRLEEAEKAFTRSLEIREKIGDERGQGMVHASIGKAFFSQGDYERAMAEFCISFEINEKLKIRHGIKIVTPLLIEVLQRLGRGEEALDYCQRALEISPKDSLLFDLHDHLSSLQKTTTEVILKQGTVKCIIHHRQGYLYGFIAPDDGSADIYFREDYINVDCLLSLAEGIHVEIEVKRGPIGPRAKNIKLID